MFPQGFSLGGETYARFLFIVSKISKMGEYCVYSQCRRKDDTKNSDKGNVNRIFILN